ncbi:hypothetical protein CAC42_2270 [Sphaceloma murrayae]|uniref:PNPLA domain-containing protein n=1 Tax=Sphaceloma murrayae TaxID=2082308 RepID=A0A2K1QJA9_9PEZI|nr:hypothetical protein CAC42_2270 [Sphaceloma murrayae]
MPTADHEVSLEVDMADDGTGECEDPRCGQTTALTFFCVDCSSEYCADCWPLQGPHRPKKVGRDGLPHEQTDARIFRRFKSILQPAAESIDEVKTAHEQDSGSKWFGVIKDQSGRLKFEDYGRYSSLLSSLRPPAEHVCRYPQLVSFVGVTNAGKSTIIKMLITRALAALRRPPGEHWATPLVGASIHDSVPTSGDVNLYADPRTHASTLPILMADCEGFEGGERLPLGAMARWRMDRQSGQSDQRVGGSAASYNIEWANTEDTRQREFAVMNLYPRILYTFSDVVVFVLRNPKTFQSAVLTKLLDWGVNSLEKSINQPALPHAIVVLNATGPTVDAREWNTSFATQNLLSSVRDALDGPESVPKLQRLAEHWRSLGKSIHTVEDLLLQYYSSFQVVRVPSSRYMLMDDQVSKLQAMIETSCAKSFHAKRKARMLTDADELSTYFQAGFRHFTTHLNVPFDFVEVSLRNNPIPSDFGGHILHLATRIMGRFRKDAERLAWFFDRLSTMLASCVMLDCVRFRKGRMSELFRNYQNSIDWALSEFFEMHWPCAFTFGNRRCEVVKARHIKGHQDTSGVIASGEYQANVSLEEAAPVFHEALQNATATIQRDFDYEADQTGKDDDLQDQQVALSLHKDYLRQFFTSVGVAAKLFSHSSCFVCLMHVPSHPLPCGHVLCSACVKAFGKPHGRSTVIVSHCPLHDDSHPWTRWQDSVHIYFKPKGVGTRVLSLDSGGIRGIVQLEILKEIEEALGNQIPIACFLDLIVGTGTGAVIAAALGIQKRRLASETIDMFVALCDMMYTPRLQIGPLGRLVQLMGGSGMYKTKPMRQALEMAFGTDRKVFGGGESGHDKIRVGMAASTGAERQGVLLSNYHRPETTLADYRLERPHEPSLEMDLWEALAAVTATPGFFKPFVHEQTHRMYLDASATIPNPSAMAERERKLLWPDTEHLDPDFFLNLGAGQNRYRVTNKLKEWKSARRGAGVKAAKAGFFAQASSLLSSTTKEEILQAEIAWLEFEETLAPSLDASGRHYFRFNPDLDEDPPAVDDRGALRSLRQTVRNRLKLPHRQTALQHLAHRLFATSFYFDLQSKTVKADGSYICKGSIFTRFEDGSEYISMLGKFLYTRLSRTFQPCFLVHAAAGDSEPFTIPLDKTIVDAMMYRSVFEVPDVEITVSDETKPTTITMFLSDHELLAPAGLPISGFPRWLLLDRSPRLVGEVHIPVPSIARSSDSGPRQASLAPAHSFRDDSSGSTSATDTTHSSYPNYEQLGIRTRPSEREDVGPHFFDPNQQAQRTNRFWTYIGPQHMARNPGQYTEDELRRFGGGSDIDGLDGESQGFPAPKLARGLLNNFPSPPSPPTPPCELETNEKVVQEQEEEWPLRRERADSKDGGGRKGKSAQVGSPPLGNTRTSPRQTLFPKT